MADSLTFNKATVTLPDGTVLEKVRFLVRGGEAYALDRQGRRTWSAAATSSRKRGRNRAEVVLASGDVLDVSNDCGCSASGRR